MRNLCPEIMKNQRAFTLVELLIVTAITAVISLAIYTTFNNGLKVWQRVNNAVPEENLNLFFDRFGSDLRNALKFSSLPFLGDRYRLEFPTLVNSPKLARRSIGKALYSYEPSGGNLNIELRDFSGIYNGEEIVKQSALSGIKSLKFWYYFYDKGIKDYVWLEEWLKEGIPLAVRVELEFDDGSQVKKYSRTISIPVGG